jgi:hypothetical protein
VSIQVCRGAGLEMLDVLWSEVLIVFDVWVTGAIIDLGEWAIALYGKGTRPFMKVTAEAVYSKMS